VHSRIVSAKSSGNRYSRGLPYRRVIAAAVDLLLCGLDAERST
jgi:hypothetical protein